MAFGRGELDHARELLHEALGFGDQSEMIEWRLPPAWGLAETALLDHDRSATPSTAARRH